MYNVDYFIQKFSAIPESKWGCGDLNKNGKSCALGLCGVEVNDINYKQNVGVVSISNPEGDALARLLKSIPETGTLDLYQSVYVINDSPSGKYPQPTPKQRILAALHDIKKMQEPKQIIRYVAVAETIKEMEVVNN